MQKKTFRSLAAVAAVSLAGATFSFFIPTPKSVTPVAYAAAVDYFLKIEGVEGESTAEGHRGEIDIESWSWGVSTPRDSASGQATGKRQHKPLTITKELDKSSPLLMRAAFDGKKHPSAILIGVNGDGNEFMRVSFFDVFVEDFMDEGSSGSPPTESVSFNYSKIEFKYTPMGADGKPGTPVTAGWDLGKNKGI